MKLKISKIFFLAVMKIDPPPPPHNWFTSSSNPAWEEEIIESLQKAYVISELSYGLFT